MRKHDIVYILKKDAKPDELRFSLRSIEANLPHRNVVFYCGKPEGIEPDRHVPHKQSGYLKWEKARSSMIEICKDDKLTKQVWLFNDDFYVLQPMTSTKPLHRGQLRDHHKAIRAKHGGMSSEYSRQLECCEALLKRAGLSTYDYALHVPILIDRAKMLEALQAFPRTPMFRSVYGNFANIGGELSPDYKTDTIDKEAPFFSTSDKTFAQNKKALEELFPTPSKYER